MGGGFSIIANRDAICAHCARSVGKCRSASSQDWLSMTAFTALWILHSYVGKLTFQHVARR
jgi:hypothetical protein